HFSGSEIGDISMFGVVLRVFFITLVPLAIGMYIRERYPQWTEERRDVVKKAAFVAFVLVVIGAVASEIEVLLDNFTDVALATLALNVAAMSVSFTVAKLARLSDRQATAIGMELGIHNSTLAIAVAGTIDIDLAIPAAVYSGFMFITAGLFARFMATRNAEPEPEPAPA
ncbi:MAG TPA: bile acid:sodium symporter, partial [Solirubrobacterales bacterium]|nr:bile acid:sodium symporter [Solirubrobacterales bacterium]